MGLIGLIWGILAIVGLAVGFLPCVGWFNWLNIPFAGVGLIISIIAMAQSRPGTQGAATGGLALNLIAIVFGVVRLILGGGVL